MRRNLVSLRIGILAVILIFGSMLLLDTDKPVDTFPTSKGAMDYIPLESSRMTGAAVAAENAMLIELMSSGGQGSVGTMGAELSSGDTKLKIWDDTDNSVKYINDSIYFYANFTNLTSGESVNGTGVNCSIILNHTGTWSAPVNMSFNENTLLYEHNETVTIRFSSYYNISCNGSALGYGIINLSDEVFVSNSPPTTPTQFYPSSGMFDYEINFTCNGSIDLEGDNLTYNIVASIINETLESETRVLVTNLTNSSTSYLWNVTNLPSQVTYVRCRAYDGYNLSIYTENSLIIDRIPNATSSIDNLTWLEDVIDTSINLTQHFNDSDGDDLNYTYVGAENISVSIDNDTGIVSLVSINNFYGNNSIVFYAWDYVGGNATSNNVTLSVINTPEVNLSSPVDGSSGFYASIGIDFFIQVEDDFLIDNCSLYINGSLNQSKTDLSLNTSLEAYNDSGTYSGSNRILTSERVKYFNLSTTEFTGFKAFLSSKNGIGPIVVKINGYHLFNITSSEVPSSPSWVNKIITNSSILVVGLNNVTFQDANSEVPAYFKLYYDANDEYMVRFTNNILAFNTTTLRKGDYLWNATCFNNQGQSSWSAETWYLTVNNSAPTTPTNITPISGTFYDEINISCGGSTDVDNDDITYTILYNDGTDHSIVSNDADGNYTWDTSQVSETSFYFKCYASDGIDNSGTKDTFPNIVTISHTGAPTTPSNLTCNGGICDNQVFTDEINLSCSGSNDTDSNFNYTFEGYYADYDGIQWHRIASVVNQSTFGNYTWNTTQIINQSNVSIRCYADDGDNIQSGYFTRVNISINQSGAPTIPLNFNYTTDFKYQVNITANGSTDPNSDSITYRIWAYYDNSWNNINDSLTNETVFIWDITSVSEQGIEFKAQASDGTHYSDFITAPTLTINREPTTPINLTPETGNYEYEINYSCSGSNNLQGFSYYVDGYYDSGWNSLTNAFPGVPVVNDTELAYNDGSYNTILSQLGSINVWRTFTINVSNGNYSYCVKGNGTGSGPRFRLYWNCDVGDNIGSTCTSSNTRDLSSSDETYCNDIELTNSGLKYLKILTTGTSSSRINTYFDHAYLVSKPFTFNVTNIQRQPNVDLRCLASDSAGNSSWFNPTGTLSINRIPRWNTSYPTSFSSPAANYEWNLSEIFSDADGDFMNFTSTGTACITTEVNSSNITITQTCTCNSGTQVFNIMADDNISITTQQIDMTFADCTGTGGGGGGGGGSDGFTILTPEEQAAETGMLMEELGGGVPVGPGTGGGGATEPELPPIPETKNRKEEITKEIISKRFSLSRHMLASHGRTQITETVSNIDLFALEDVRVRITIPKDIIESTDDIIVVTPFLIMEKDPVIEFDVGDIQPYKDIELVYVLNNEITENKFERIIVEIIPKELSEEERARREQEIRDKIEETEKVIEIKREIEIGEETTTYTLDIEFKEESVLYDVSIFEEIPKCLIEIIEEELIDSNFEFEIVNADPLIVWHFDKLTKDQRIQYTINQFTEKDCANKAKAVPLAQQIILITQKYSPRKASLSLIPIPIILLVLIFFSKFGEGKRHEEEYINKLTKYAKAEYKIGRTEGEVKKTLTDHGHKEEYVNQAITLNTRNRLHHWLVRLEIGLEELILLFIIGLGILDFLEILPGDLDFLKKAISWVILGYLIFRVSPTNILFGHKSKYVDLGLIIGYFALIMKNLVNFTRNFDVTSEVYHLRDLFLYINRHEVLFESSFFIGGIVLLIILSIYISLRFEIKQPSIMALLHVTGHMHKKREFITRFIISHLLIIGFFIVVFNLLTEWLAIAVDAPIITAAIFFWIFVLVKHKNRFKPIEIIYKIGNVGEKFYEKFIDLFHYKKTLFLGLAGMKLLHLVTDIGNFLIPYTTGLTDAIYFGSLGSGHNALFSLFNGASLFNSEIVGMSILFRIALALGYIANIIALLILLALPALLWYHMYKYRELPVSKVPIFRLSKGAIALFFSTITVFFIAPAFKIGHIKGDGLAGVDITTHSIASFPSLELLLLVAFFVGIITYLLCHTKIRKYLKRIVIVSALTFLGYYMWNYFANVVIYFVDKIILLLEAKPFITAYLIAFLFVNIIFYLVGLASYFVELFLRNELGFKAFVEREWLGILSHHDMHHIHYSNSHDEDKHGPEIEALMKFTENEVAHSSNPIKTIDKLAHHSWNLNTIEEAVKQANIDDLHKQDMLNYVAERKEKIRPLIEYIRRYKDMAPIKVVLKKAVKSGWSVEDIRLAEKEV